MSMVFPFSVVYFATPILELPYDPNIKRNWENLLRSYRDLKYLLPDS